MKLLVVCFVTLLFFTGCAKDKGRMQTVLDRADSLISNGNYEIADSVFGEIDEKNLYRESEKALYYLLRAQLDCAHDKFLDADSLMAFSVDYYKRNGDKEKLARAYYYYGMYFIAQGKEKEVLLMLKNAEHVDKENEPSWLRYHIYINLSFLNHLAGADRIALDYAFKSLDYAMKEDNVTLTCYAYNNIVLSYAGLNMEDSAYFYVRKIIPFLDKIKDEEIRAVYMTNVGYFYYKQGLYDKSERILLKTVAKYPYPMALINLGMTYTMLGKEAEADSLFRLAWAGADYQEKAELLQFRAEQAGKKGDFEASAELYRRAKAMQDSVEISRDTEGVVTSQREYEQKNYRQRVRRTEAEALIIAALAVAALTAAGVTLYRRKMGKVQKTVSDGNRRIAEYTARIKALEQADRHHSDEARRLERKIRRLKDEQNTVINRGKSLYEGIMAGGNTATWKKNDFDEFIEYYRMGHPDMVAGAENGYRRLSSANIFYLILADMGIDDAGVQRIMCMSPGAVRTMKSRIKGKMKA